MSHGQLNWDLRAARSVEDSGSKAHTSSDNYDDHSNKRDNEASRTSLLFLSLALIHRGNFLRHMLLHIDHNLGVAWGVAIILFGFARTFHLLVTNLNFGACIGQPLFYWFFAVPGIFLSGIFPSGLFLKFPQ